ncbi:endolytic transglycosylase MltG [Candidatus Stoquefichus sp. SB1]|uniref:endolytic transglycosylase MltG n=1 Tax=Candidatus Stoquefichus sp. SB1 TaxID=1658109 RepID=UPI00067F4F67|nr:endolytic transglycosylase MltG [Candidatus Stoquefichus sp. SB1]
MKNKKIIFIVIGIIIAVALLGSFFFYNSGISAVSSKSEEVIVKIESGSSATQMLDTLDQAGLVNNKMCGKIFLKLNHFDNLQANTYILNKNMSLSKIFSIIEDPDFEYILKSKLTIKEGNTIPEVAKSFGEILDLSKDDIIKQWGKQDYLKSLIKNYWFIDESILNKEIMYPLEGYLYPETYYITEENPTLESVTKLALDMMDKKLSVYKDDIQKLGWTPHQFLSFASVVERESGTDETDRPMIAGVFKNRLDQGRLLQSDITVNYAWQRTGVNVSTAHLQIDSKYNTYKYTGLPVGPISTIPESTMKACIEYKHHDYLFFFAMKDPQDKTKSKVVYTKTYEEHMKEVQKAKDAGLWLE